MKQDIKEFGVTTILQNKEKEMLEDLKILFEKYDIPFFLACGTALGCIRHKGFIPWDDDVDIYIRGEDYSRVREVFETQDTGTLEFQDYMTVPRYPYSFPKIIARDTILKEDSLKHLNYSCGVYIDVFPLMSVPNDFKARKQMEKKRYYYYCLLKAYYFKFSGIKRILNIIAHLLVNPQKVQEKLYKQYTSKVKDAEYLIDTGTYGSQALIKRKDFETTINIEFEKLEMPMPCGYDSYLKGYYGDYMQLPPEGQRISRHPLYELVINGEKVI